MQELVVITGGGTGIGRETALLLAKHGYAVVIAGRRLAPLQAVQAEASHAINYVIADISTATGCQTLVDYVATRATKIKFFIQNAGSAEPIGKLSSVDLTAFRQLLATNLEGPLLLTQKLLPFLTAGSRILHIGSGAAHFVIDMLGAYCVSKAAFLMMYNVLKAELVNQQIYVGSVRPGIVDTAMSDAFLDPAYADFEAAPHYAALKRNKETIPPATVAAFIRWALCDLSPEIYSAQEWDLYDESHHNRWRGDLPLPIPDYVKAAQ